MDGRTPRRIGTPLLAAAAVTGLIPVLEPLVVPDLNWCYRYLQYDSYDWIQNGLFWAGAPVVPSLRPPLLSLAIAALWRLGALSLLPLLNFAALLATAALLFRLLRERHSSFVAGYAAWIFFANGYIQNHTRWIMPEPYPTFFLVAAAYAFHRAAERPRAYVWVGALLGTGCLLQLATPPAGLAFGLAVLLSRRGDLRRKELWAGAAAAVLPPLVWLAARSLVLRGRPPWAPRFLTIELAGLSLENVPFYAFAGVALLGLPLVPLYALGLARALRRPALGDPYRASYLAPLAGLTVFFVFCYRWADKRFLYYAFPFAVCLLAEGVERLVAWGKKSGAAALTAGAALGICLAWNSIAYPDYALGYLALTPTRFLEAVARGKPDLIGNDTFHLRGARVVTLHPDVVSAFSEGLFDFRRRPEPACSRNEPDYTALLALKPELDRRLGRGAPIGYHDLPGFPQWNSAMLRLGNVLERPVVLPRYADYGLSAGPVPDAATILRCGPYRLVKSVR